MKSSRVFTCLMALVAVGLAPRSYAQTPFYQLDASAEAFNAGEGMTPRQGNHVSGNDFVAAEAELTIGGTTARALATSDFNKLGAFARVVASLPELNDMMGGAATATWQDSLFFERDGVRITSGSVRVSADIDGTISLSGEGAGARATLNLSAGGLTKEVSFTESGSHQDTLRIIETGAWDALEGLPVKLQLFLGGGNNSFSPSTTEVDFSSTATITSVVYLTPEGQPDSSVTIISASGTVYGVPEPTCGALAVVCLCSAGGRFRRRS